MIYASLLIVTVGLCFWVALDLIARVTGRPRIVSLATLASAAARGGAIFKLTLPSAKDEPARLRD